MQHLHTVTTYFSSIQSSSNEATISPFVVDTDFVKIRIRNYQCKSGPCWRRKSYEEWNAVLLKTKVLWGMKYCTVDDESPMRNEILCCWRRKSYEEWNTALLTTKVLWGMKYCTVDDKSPMRNEILYCWRRKSYEEWNTVLLTELSYPDGKLTDQSWSCLSW